MAHRWDPIAPPVTGLVRPVRVDPTGLTGPTRGQARGTAWRSIAPGLVVAADVSHELVETRILEAFALVGTRAVITGWAALRLHGGGFFDGLHRDDRTLRPTRRWYRDVRTIEEALEMSVEECRSPPEDRFRLIWEYDAGWGRPLINRAVLDQHGRLIAVPDLLDARSWAATCANPSW